MFEYSALHWTTFFTAAVLLNLSPGPDFAFILAQTARGGRRPGFAAMFGIWTGALGHVAMAAVGLSTILATSATAFSVIKWAGAAYLIWLGVNAFRSGGAAAGDPVVVREPALLAIYRQGVLVSLLNPKVAMFFLAFLPQFVVVGAGPNWAQLALHGILIVVIAAMIEPVLVLTGEKVVAALKSNARTGRLMERALGVIFISLGVRLALLER
ncbi:LysE family translocator [uncultured Hoeflea sp.]|uniref:LysE family translocator n=1 Tax=uncultured Hoeflea sp. TaxID=538666 RepID=UPI00262B361D|nr:LysE family translocator [uncultured Hoeflea sp.]